MSKTIAVSCASGKVGKALATQLLAQGHTVRVIGRNAEHLEPLIARGGQPWVGSVDDPKFMARALRGADSFFAMVPPDYAHPDPRGYYRRVAEGSAAGAQVARVREVVTLSSVGAEQSDGVGMIGGAHDFEQRFNQIPGLNLLHLRPGLFFENFFSSIPLIRGAGINGGALHPDVPLPMIASRDIASRAAELLGRRSIEGRQVMELPGPRDYTQRQATAILGNAIGISDLQYVQFSYEDSAGALQLAGFSPASANSFVEMQHAFNEERIRRQPRSPETTTPTTLEEFARDLFAPAYSNS